MSEFPALPQSQPEGGRGSQNLDSGFGLERILNIWLLLNSILGFSYAEMGGGGVGGGGTVMFLLYY